MSSRLAKALLAVALAGCNGNFGTLPAAPYAPSSPAGFDVLVFNGTAWPLVISVNGGPQYVVPIGTTADSPFPSGPSSVSVSAAEITGGGQLFWLPTRNVTPGPGDASAIINFP